MKSLILSAALALSTMATIASDTKGTKVLSYKASQNLIAQFGEVEHVEWAYAMNNMIRANFIVQDEAVSAFFSTDGEFLASTRELSRQQLPLKLRMAMDKKIGDAEITKMFEMNSPGEHAYFIETLVNGKKRVWKGYDYGALGTYHLSR